LGDTIQSLMALRAAKQLYPNLKIHLLARERFAVAASRVPWIDKVYTLPTDTLLGPIIQGKKSESQGIQDLARWIAPLIEERWDMVINWTFSEASSYLTALIPARVKLGYTRRRDSSFSGTDGWSHYVQAIVQSSVHQNIHLTDILTTQLLTALQIHIGDPSPQADTQAPVTSKAFFALELDEGAAFQMNREVDSAKKCFAIQLGAAQKSKTWSPKNWAQLANLILQRHSDHHLYLLGGKEDQVRSQEFLEELASLSGDLSRVVSMVGTTTFDLWASIISQCQWVLAGDTAAIHLASVLGIRVMNLSVGPVRHTETGPYGNGHYVISEDPEQENSSEISPEGVYAVWSYATTEWAHRRQLPIDSHFAQLGWLDKLSPLRVYRSKIRSTQDGGGVVYEGMTTKPLLMQEWTGMVMGYLARGWYCGWIPPIGQELVRETISPALVQTLRELDEATHVLTQICQQAASTADELNLKSSGLKSDKLMGVDDRAELQKLGRTLLELEVLLERVTKMNPCLVAFSQMAKVLMHHLQGSHLADLGKETGDAYRQLNEGIGIFRQWIQYTLTLAKPVAVKTNPAGMSELTLLNPGKDLTP
jgi:ADP-heptose:LPS heptosyltransferase